MTGRLPARRTPGRSSRRDEVRPAVDRGIVAGQADRCDGIVFAEAIETMVENRAENRSRYGHTQRECNQGSPQALHVSSYLTFTG